MIPKLDTCPCCGGAAQINRYTGDVGYIRCLKCGLQTPYLKIDVAAIRWNRRPGKDMK